jgi:hypothetical protein
MEWEESHNLIHLPYESWGDDTFLRGIYPIIKWKNVCGRRLHALREGFFKGYCKYNSSSSSTLPKAIRSRIVSSIPIISAGVMTNSPYLSFILSIASATVGTGQTCPALPG